MGWSEGSHQGKNLSEHTALLFEIPPAAAGYTLMDKTETWIQRVSEFIFVTLGKETNSIDLNIGYSHGKQ